MNRIQLADAMLKGLHTKGVEESRGNYIAVQGLYNACLACALGCALIGHYDGDFNKAEEIFDRHCDYTGDDMDIETCAELLDIPASLAVVIEHKHLNGLTIEDIAKWLKGGQE